MVILLTLPAVLMGKDRVLNGIRAYVPDMPERAEKEPDKWTFSADRVSAHHTSEYIEASGNCTLAMGSNLVRADFARYYRETGWILLRGNVRARWEGDFLEADEAEFDLNNMLGWLKNGRAFMAKPHVYVDSELIERKVGGSYSFKNARVTRCSGDTPAWSVTSSEGDVTLDGRVRLYHTAFRVKNLPVAYLPYASLPAQRGRQSGFLFPEFGSSSRLGFHMDMAYYWVINDEMDVTVSENFMSKRGLMHGVELRHTEDEDSKGLWQANWLIDNQRAAKESDEDDIFQGDGLTRPNRNRWWVRGKYDGWLYSPKWKVMADIDLVSDQNYLREFRYGRSGFDSSREEFIEQFGRDIDNADSSVRTNTLYGSRSWDRFGVAGKVEYKQNLDYMNGNGKSKDNPTVQTLPELDAFAWKDTIPGTPLEFDGSAKYDYFQRNYGDSGHRFDVRPQISLPLASKFVTVIPRAKVYATLYNTTGHEKESNRSNSRFDVETNSTKGGTQTRFGWEAAVSMFSELGRIYQMDGSPELTPASAGQSKWRSIRHTIIPRIDYSYRHSMGGQEKLPYYDSRDRLAAEDLTTYSLTNTFTRKRETVKLRRGEDGKPVPYLTTDYLDFMSVRLEQSYDRNEAQRDDMRDAYPRRPLSDLMAEVIVRPDDYVDVILRSWWSPYIQKITQTESTIRVYDDEIGEVYVGFDMLGTVDEYKRYRDEAMAVGKVGGSLRLAKNITLGADYRRDFNGNRDLEKSVRLTFEGECYDVYLGYSQTPGNNRIEVGFDILKF